MGKIIITILIAYFLNIKTYAKDFKTKFNTFVELSKDILSNGSYEIYFPYLTWHDRFFDTYSKEQIASYNESPWGFGIGKSIINKEGDLQGLFFMKFQDSHNKSQYILVYNKQINMLKNIYDDFTLFLGYIAGFSFRDDMINYFPIPAVSFIFGANYKNISFEGSFLPFFNVLLLWVKYKF